MNFTKFFAAAAVGVFCATVANAETISEEYVIDFTTYQVGHQLNSFWGGANPGMVVVENPNGEGNLFNMSGSDGVSEEGFATWNTLARITPFSLPGGYNMSNVTMITAEFMPTQADGLKFGIQLQNAMSDYLIFDDAPVVNEWNTAVFDPADLVSEAGDPMDLTAGYDFCFGIKGSTNYYVKNITFYLEKEVTQREKDEAALDKNTAACVEVNFDNWEVSGPDAEGNFSSPHVGSNGGGINRPDMIIDQGPEGYNNNCAHIIYQGWTQIFLADAIEIPEGYTFDDLRLIEYDIYETTEPGVDYTKPAEPNNARNGAPYLKLKERYAWGYEPLGNGGSFGTTQLPSTNEWHHVEFRPSTFAWSARDFKQNVLDEDGNVKKDDEGNDIQEDIHWEADQTYAEFNKVTKFNMSIGFFPCNSQCYVDNIKCWFQKGGQTGIANVVAAPAAEDWNVYNLQGIRVMKAACEADIYTLPAGLYIANGKKYLVK